jgi:hypothetical protein
LWATAPVIQRSELRVHLEEEQRAFALKLQELTRQNAENEQARREAAERQDVEIESLRAELSAVRVAARSTRTAPMSELEVLAESTRRNHESVLRADLVLLSDELNTASNTILTAMNDGPYWKQDIATTVCQAVKDKHSGVNGFHAPRAAVRDSYRAIASAETLRMHHEIDRQIGAHGVMFSMNERDHAELLGVLERIVAGENSLREFLDTLTAPERT